MLLEAARRRRGTDGGASGLKKSTTSQAINKEQIDEEATISENEDGLLRSYETDDLIKTPSSEKPDQHISFMNQSFGAKIIVEDYSPKKDVKTDDDSYTYSAFLQDK